MKIGPRIPTLSKSFAARTSLKRYVRQSMGIKAPRGYGWLTNPRRVAYNRVYDRTSWSTKGSFGWMVAILLAISKRS